MGSCSFAPTGAPVSTDGTTSDGLPSPAVVVGDVAGVGSTPEESSVPVGSAGAVPTETGDPSVPIGPVGVVSSPDG